MYDCVVAVGNVLHTLHEGNAVFGVTCLDNRLYMLRDKSSQQIEVYDTQTYRLLQKLTVPRFSAMNDIVSCAHNRCLYIADANKASINTSSHLPSHSSHLTSYAV